MSKPKYCWYGFVKKMIMSGYYNQDTENAQKLRTAMQDVEAQIMELPNGAERMTAIDEILIRHTKTYDGVALELHYHKNIIKRWVAQYVNQVGKRGGW